MRLRHVAICLILAGCHKAGSSDTAPDAGARANPNLPAAIEVSDARKDLIYSWQDADGSFHDTQKSSEVPEAFRKHVLVRDLSRSPDELHSDEYLYVADLTEHDDDGGYPYAVVSRYRFKLPTVFTTSDGGFEESVVTVYGTSWCGACAQARQYFTEHHIPFVDKDIEKDGEAAQELAQKAKRAGIEPRGVPVIDVRGHLLEGFSPAAVEEALKGG
jgi:glutaredoxin